MIFLKTVLHPTLTQAPPVATKRLGAVLFQELTPNVSRMVLPACCCSSGTAKALLTQRPGTTPGTDVRPAGVQAHRKDDDIAIVNGGMRVQMAQDSAGGSLQDSPLGFS